MEKRFLYFLLINFFLAQVLRAQDSLPPVYEIKADTADIQLPDSHWQMLEDSSGKWTINEVLSSSLSSRFHANNTDKTGFGYSGLRDYWQRFRLKNLTGKDEKIVFRASVDQLDLYVIRDTGRTEHFVNGTYVPYSKRDGYKRNYGIPVTLKAGEEIIVYKKLYTRRAGAFNELSAEFTFDDQFLRSTYVDAPWYFGDVRNWLIAGILFFGFFFNLFFYLIDRDKVYLYMALLLLTEGIWYLTMNPNILFRESLVFRQHVVFFIGHLAFFTSVTQFVRYFLKTRTHFPKWDKVILTLLIIMIVTATIRYFYFPDIVSKSTHPWFDFAVSVCFFGLLTALLFSFIFCRKQKDRLTNLSVAAAIPAFFLWSFGYLLGSIFGLMLRLSDQEPGDFVAWYFRNEFVIEMFLVAWFAILFTWIMLQRYSMLRKQYVQQALEREKEKTELINQQKGLLEAEVKQRTAELQKSLEELKTTQSQLIQSEKMASLGELTAGIAHEIQNPLNFVNNFSEVSNELLEEMRIELQKGNAAAALSIAENVQSNLGKVLHHGKRADGIVKGMLQHSRTSNGQKEPTDVNALADEYLRLAFHGLRAKDKTFNATFKTDFDNSIGKINIIPQDMGRVVLNLITNAFHSVMEKKKQMRDHYEPTVTVITKKINDKVEIRVRDNGNGIPQKVMDKIFQPFFTTKPAGQGTGLGLSLSYDIVVKGHRGELRAETKEGEFAEFIIQLPV